MRRSLLALAFVGLLSSPAAAQYPVGADLQSNLALIAPTAPATDSSNRIATTAWANSWLTSAMPLASGKIWIGSVGNIAVPQTPSGDLTVSNGGVFTFGTVNSNVGSFGSATLCPIVTFNGKGLTTAASSVTCTPAIGSITGLGAGVATWAGTPSSANLRAALTDETGTGLAYFQGGDIGTPSAGVGSNLTSLNATQLTSGTLPAARTNGHMNGTATNDNAAAGEVAEYTECVLLQASATSLTTNTGKDVCTVSLTAGDWDVSGAIGFLPNAATSITVLYGGWSTTANTTDTTAGKYFQMVTPAQVPTAIAQEYAVPTYRFSLSATTTVRLVALSIFTVNTQTAFGAIRARRAR